MSVSRVPDTSETWQTTARRGDRAWSLPACWSVSCCSACGCGVARRRPGTRTGRRHPVGVVVAITVDNGGGADTVELHTNSRFNTEAALDGHTVDLVGLTPMPREGSTIEVDQYQATLVVTRRAA